jgi:hypothetical protein
MLIAERLTDDSGHENLPPWRMLAAASSLLPERDG